MAEGKDQREQRVGASPANQQPVWAWAWQKPHPLGIFQVVWGVGKTHSFSQFPVKLRQGKQGDRRGVWKGEMGSSGALWSGGTPLSQLLDKGFNYFLFHFLQFLPHLFQKLLFHSLQV